MLLNIISAKVIVDDIVIWSLTVDEEHNQRLRNVDSCKGIQSETYRRVK